ncbi:TRAP transporter large permease [Pseudoflavonifractor phocaeensis]|uniref:TRAP transporter large permease n=1 Tax=Pseudoflavonifractor phocaeensis TaxID=1870988 RepID=UPI00313F2E7A
MQGAVAGIVIFVIFMALCFMTVPIGISIGAACVIYCLLGGSVDMNYITTNMFTGCDSFPLMAIPFFVLSGALMEGGGLSKRLVNFFDAFVGHKTGGLAIVCVIACMFFGAISGSAPATVAAIGTIMAPSMIERGYSKGFTMALIAASGCLGTIIPPSIPMVMFGVATGTSISSLFMAGFLPGISCGLCLIVLSVMTSKKNGWTGNGLTFTWARVGREFKDAIWALLVPVIILGGIYGGIFTPTEAAVVAVVYALIIGLFVYKELDLSTVWVKLFDSAKTTGTILIIVATGTVLGRVLTLEQIPTMVATALQSFTDSRFVILLVIDLILLVVGCLMETTSAILIIAPILTPVVAAFGVNPIHFGIIMVVNLSIGFITPPVGANLFVACGVGNIKFQELVKNIWTFLIALLVALVAITYIEPIAMLLPNLFS